MCGVWALSLILHAVTLGWQVLHLQKEDMALDARHIPYSSRGTLFYRV
jgi:hypothetical protein